MLSYLAEVVCTAQRNIAVWREHGRLCARRKAGVHAFVLDALSVLTRLFLETEQVDGQLGEPRQHLSIALWTLPVSLRGGTSKRWQKRTEQGSCARRWHARCLRRCREDACADRTLPSPASGASAPASTLTTSRCWFQIGFDRCLNTTHRGIEGWCAPWPVPPVPPVPL